MSNADPLGLGNIEASLLKREPVIAATVAGTVVTDVIEVLVTHGVLTSVQASPLTQAVLPIVTSAVLLGLGLVARSVVVPAFKVALRIEAAVEKRVGGQG